MRPALLLRDVEYCPGWTGYHPRPQLQLEVYAVTRLLMRPVLLLRDVEWVWYIRCWDLAHWLAKGIVTLVPAGVRVNHQAHNTQNNAECTHPSTVNNVLQCLRVEILHKPRVSPKKALDVLSSLEDIANLVLPEEISFLIYKPFKCQ